MTQQQNVCAQTSTIWLFCVFAVFLNLINFISIDRKETSYESQELQVGRPSFLDVVLIGRWPSDAIYTSA